MKNKISLKEIARDFIAIGSPVFFILVLARISLLSNYEYLSQFLIAGIVFMVLFFAFKGNLYSGLGMITLIFTTLFYNNIKFTIFGIGAYALLLVSLWYLKHDKKEIIYGILLGAISAGISYYAVRFLFS